MAELSAYHAAAAEQPKESELLGPLYVSRRKKSYAASVVGLIAHLAGTAIIFSTVFVFGWLVSVLFHWLHAIHPFGEEIFKIISRLEVGLIYVDICLSLIVLFAGAWRFCAELFEGGSLDDGRPL